MDDLIMRTCKKRKATHERWRPSYHFTPQNGWMNDPNGLIYFKGWYHLFYQHNPKDCDWGQMHWGHAVSKDMIHWKDMQIALFPDKAYENHSRGGCFSGSAVEKDGVLYLFYTSTTQHKDKSIQTQSLAISEDGVHFEKYAGNPIIAKMPNGMSEDFRDPKVLYTNEKWYMVVGGTDKGADNKQADGKVYLYDSNDLIHWNYKGILLSSDGKLGTMFECPDLFQLDGKWVLTCSPMNHPYGNKAMYCVGNIDFDNCRFQIERIGNMDVGFDYYAPQSFMDKHGKRVLMAWANEWSWMSWWKGFGPTDTEGWRGTLIIPREVSLDDNLMLHHKPVIELENLEEHHVLYHNISVAEEKSMIQINHAASYKVVFHIQKEQVISKYLEIGLFASRDRSAMLSVDFLNGIVIFDKQNVDDYERGTMISTFDKSTEELTLTILIDHSIIEIFGDSDMDCISCNVYPEDEREYIWVKTPYKKAEILKIDICSIMTAW